MLKPIRKLIRSRKAISPVVSALLLIALTVSSVALTVYVVIPYLNTSSIFARITKVTDTDKDSRYNQITLYLSNAGTRQVEITNVIVWTTTVDNLGRQNDWVKHEGWNFTKASANIVYPSVLREETLEVADKNEQIELTINADTYYKLEIEYTGSSNPYYTDWETLNDQVDFTDLIDDFETFDLQAWGFTGSIDVPGWVNNNYFTYGGPEHGPIQEDQNLYLPVPEQTDWVKFFVTGKIVIFHSNQGNLTNQPTFLQINRTAVPFRANYFYILGLAGSWGDWFPTGATALTLNITYTDGSSAIWEMGHDYIDDWWYTSNPGDVCISAPSGKIIEIDLGIQVDDPPGQRIHTHTATFMLDPFKYIQYISFTDPGNDNSGPHLLSITAG